MSTLSAWPQSLSRVPSWSEYLGGDRRRHDRFRELVDSGPDAIEEELRNFVRNAPPEDVAENPRAVWQSALETLDLPGNATRTLLYSKILGVKPSSKEEFAGLRKVYGSDLLQHMGWKPDSLIGKAGQFLAGLTLDYIVDPLTWGAGLAGFAAGTVVGGPGVGAAAGLGAVSAVGGVKKLLQAIRGAEEVGKGLSVATKVGKAGRVLERLHVRPEALGKLAKLAEEEEGLIRAGTKTAEAVGEGLSPELVSAARRLRPEDLYSGRWGLGAGTTPIRTTPFGHIIAGAPIIAGKVAGKGVEYLGRALGKIPAVGPVIGAPIELAGRAAQFPVDALGHLSSALGTPFKRIPQADVFMPFAEMPVVGPALAKVKASIAASPAAAPIAEGFRKIKEGLSAMGIGSKGSLYQLLLDLIAKGRAAQRLDLAKGELSALRADYERIGRETGMDPRDVGSLSSTTAEHAGIIAEAAKRGRGPLEQALEETRYKIEALLGDRYPQAKIQRATDQIMGAVGEATGLPELLPAGLERIQATAIKLPNGQIVTGQVHAEAVAKAAAEKGISDDQVVAFLEHVDDPYGYVTTQGRYVNHEEARRIAIDYRDPNGLVADVRNARARDHLETGYTPGTPPELLPRKLRPELGREAAGLSHKPKKERVLTGLSAATKRVMEIHAKYADAIGGGADEMIGLEGSMPSTNLGDLLAPGYTFRSAGEMAGVTNNLTEKEIKQFTRRGLLKIGESGTGEWVMSAIRDAGHEDPGKVMADAMRGFAGEGDTRKLEAVREFLAKNPELTHPADDYWVAVHDRAAGGQDARPFLKKNPELVGADQLSVGQRFTRAGEPFEVRERGENQGEAFAAVDGGGGTGRVYLEGGRPLAIDKGSLLTVEESRKLRDAETFTDRYRSESHAKLARAVREAGMDDTQATLFDAATEDLSEDHLSKLDVQVAQTTFTGAYQALTKTLTLGKGRVSQAAEALHELGHFAWGTIFDDTQRGRFQTWYRELPIERRIKLFERATPDPLLARYFAGDPTLSVAEKAKFQSMTEAQWGRVAAEPEREGFGQLFAHYALTRRAAAPEVAPLFGRVMDVVKKMWARLRPRAGEVEQPMVDLLERLFDPAKRRQKLPDYAVSLDLAGDAVLPGGLAGRHSRAWTEGRGGDAKAAAKWATETIGQASVGKMDRLAEGMPEKLIFVPVPSPSGQNALPRAMADRLAELTGGNVRDLLETNLTQERVRKGVLRRIGNSRNFVLARFPDLPADYRVVLVDDFMYSGGTARDAAHALNSAGVDVAGVVVGRGLRPVKRTSLGQNALDVAHLRGIGAENVQLLEDTIGRPLHELAAGEANELRARLEAGQKPDEIARLIHEGKRAPTADLDLPDASVINPDTIRPLDDVPQGEDQLVMEVRAAVAAGTKPNSEAVIEYARANWTPEQRSTLLGAAKLGGIKREGAKAVIDTALLKLGHPYRGRNWENVFEQLQHAERGEIPSRGQGWLYSQGLEGVLYEGTAGPTYSPRLTPTGSKALTAMREAVRVGGDPDHVARTMAALADVRIAMMQKQRGIGIMPQGLRARAARLERVLDNMGRKITDDAAWTATHATGTIEGGPGAPGRRPPSGPPPMPGTGALGPGVPAPTPHQIWAAPVADLVVRMQRLAEKSRSELTAAGIRVPNIKTERGLGYFPRMLGDPGTVIGKIMRHWGMSWEGEAAKLRGLQQRQAGQEAPRDAYHFVTEAILRENTARLKNGLAAIPVPSRDSPLSQQIAEILDTYPELRPEHRAQLHRQFLVESTIDEINQIAEHTGTSFQTDPVAVWTTYRNQEHMAIAGADYLREVIRSGVDGGWAVKVSPMGEVPKGFERITDGRFGNMAKGFAFSAEVVRDFNKFRGVMEKPHAIFKAFDWVTSQFRTAVLSVFPYTVTNLLSGTFQNMFFDAYHPESYKAAFGMMDDYHRGLNLDKPVAAYYAKGDPAAKAFAGMTNREYMELLSIEYGEFGRGNYGVEMAHEVSANVRDEWSVVGQFKDAMKRGRALFPEPAQTSLGRAAQKTLGALGGLTGVVRDDAGRIRVGLSEGGYFRAFRALNAYVEDAQGVAHILERMRRGATIDEAVQTKRLALNQSANLTDLEQKTFRRLIPFWGWMKGNALLQWRMAVARPQMAGLVAKIRGNLEAAMVGEESLPPSMRPRHVAGELGVQLTGGEKPEFYNLTRLFPIAELGLTPMAGTKLPGNIIQETVQRLNPVLKTPIEMATNRDIFWDRPLTEYGEQKKTWLGMRLSPTTKNVLRMLRPLNVMEQVSWRGVPTTAGEAGAFAAQSAGARLFPVDVARQVFEREKTLRDQLSAIMRDMYRRRREVERSKGEWRTDEEVLRLSGIYQGLSEELGRLPIKALRRQSTEERRAARTARGELKELAASN
jgi:hypothetical protein